MPDIITLALIATASFLGDWWQGRNAPAATAAGTAPDTGVYDWKNDAGVKWRR